MTFGQRVNKTAKGKKKVSREDFLKDARAVGKALSGDVKGLQKAQVKVAEWLFARLEKVMITAMFDPQIAPTGNQKRVIPVYVGLAVACAVIDDGVVQHGTIAFGCIGHFTQEASQSVALKLVVGSEILHGFSA